MERFHSLIDLYQNVTNDLIDCYITLNGHYLNQIMKNTQHRHCRFLPLVTAGWDLWHEFRVHPVTKVGARIFHPARNHDNYRSYFSPVV